ncbi:unnamed protein product [Mytilus coruscus]|uniref:THAP-type domain-containing protein n=1 Tax=Mytilus coruscus TaxID=42192 RepID=A0A6J8BAV3_MYTCO|nr:unnamed protein product [Mytilus coruscus]
MPSCQAIKCVNERGKCGKSFFEISDPLKSSEKRKLCKLWIDHLCNDKLKIETFVWGKAELNLIAESLGFKSGRLTLKPGAVPTIVKPGPGVADRQKERISTKIFQEKRRKAQNVPVHAEQHDEVPLLTIPEILPCGHPCEVCRKIKGDENVLVIDHSYSKSKAEADTSSEIQHASSSETPAKKDKPIFISSTPLKTDFQKCAVEPIFTPVNILDESFVSLTQEDDTEDIDYSLSVDQVESDSDNFENDISTCYTEEQKLIKENKFIVFESAIDTLINKLKFNICECPVDPDDIIKDLSKGTVITITAFCTSGHLVVKWSSQPFVGKMPVGNLLVSAATLFCGQTYSYISQVAEFCNLQYISHTTYNKIQRQCLMPVVQHTWSLLQEVELKKIKEQNRQIRLAGDGRCDSPGFSAKYCTYLLLDIETQRIITFVVVKVTETGSSSKMELKVFEDA